MPELDIHQQIIDSGYRARAQEELAAIAEEFNCELYVPKPHELLIDLDGPDAVNTFETMLPLAVEKFHVQITNSWTSRNGGRHVVLETPFHLSEEARIALQACLGSDLKRELLLLWETDQLRSGESASTVNCLFKPHGA